jgi:hypothetical protein
MRSLRVRSAASVIAVVAIAACAINPTEIEPAREVSCFAAARVSLSDAIYSAEIEGGKAIDAAYRQDEEMGCVRGEPGYYDVTVLFDGKLSLVSVDAGSKQVGPRLEPGFMRELTGQFAERVFEGTSESRVPIAQRLKLPLLEAVATAEKGGGKAMEARADMNAGKIGYWVKLVDKGQLRLAWVDGG